MIYIFIAIILFFIVLAKKNKHDTRAQISETYRYSIEDAYHRAMGILEPRFPDREDLKIITATFIPMIGRWVVPDKVKPLYGEAAGEFSDSVFLSDKEQQEASLSLQFFHAMINLKSPRDDWRTTRLTQSAFNNPSIVLYTAFGDMLYNHTDIHNYYDPFANRFFSAYDESFEEFYTTEFLQIIEDFQFRIRNAE